MSMYQLGKAHSTNYKKFPQRAALLRHGPREGAIQQKTKSSLKKIHDNLRVGDYI